MTSAPFCAFYWTADGAGWFPPDRLPSILRRKTAAYAASVYFFRFSTTRTVNANGEILRARHSSATNRRANRQARSAETPFLCDELRERTGAFRGNAILPRRTAAQSDRHAPRKRPSFARSEPPRGEIGLTRRTPPPRRTAPKRSPAPQTRFPRARRRKSSASAPCRWDARIPMRRPPACTEARPTWADPGCPA